MRLIKHFNIYLVYICLSILFVSSFTSCNNNNYPEETVINWNDMLVGNWAYDKTLPVMLFQFYDDDEFYFTMANSTDDYVMLNGTYSATQYQLTLNYSNGVVDKFTYEVSTNYLTVYMSSKAYQFVRQYK